MSRPPASRRVTSGANIRPPSGTKPTNTSRSPVKSAGARVDRPRHDLGGARLAELRAECLEEPVIQQRAIPERRVQFESQLIFRGDGGPADPGPRFSSVGQAFSTT